MFKVNPATDQLEQNLSVINMTSLWINERTLMKAHILGAGKL